MSWKMREMIKFDNRRRMARTILGGFQYKGDEKFDSHDDHDHDHDKGISRNGDGDAGQEQ